MAESGVEALVADVDGNVREIVDCLRDVVRRVIPDAVEEPDPSAKLIGYTYQPGTYKGLIVAIAPHTAHVNLMFSKGVGCSTPTPADCWRAPARRPATSSSASRARSTGRRSTP